MPAMFIWRGVICIGPFSARVECLEEKYISSHSKLQERSLKANFNEENVEKKYLSYRLQSVAKILLPVLN